MNYNRSHRVGGLLLEFLARLLVSELDDPRLGAVALTGINLRRDLKHATVYFNVRKDQCDIQVAMDGLKQATGYMRTKIGSELGLRFVPTIAWEFDETPDRAQRLDELLRSSD